MNFANSEHYSCWLVYCEIQTHPFQAALGFFSRTFFQLERIEIELQNSQGSSPSVEKINLRAESSNVLGTLEWSGEE